LILVVVVVVAPCSAWGLGNLFLGAKVTTVPTHGGGLTHLSSGRNNHHHPATSSSVQKEPFLFRIAL
jgi:hypothetical protein